MALWSTAMRGLFTTVLWALTTVAGTAAEVRDTSPPKSIELDDLIPMFMLLALPENKNFREFPGWDVAAEPDTPIHWITSGTAEAPEYLNQDGYYYQRRGTVVVTINGKPTHSVLRQTVETGKWTVTLLGPRCCPTRVDMSPDGDFSSDLKHELKAPRFTLKPFLCDRATEPASTGYVVYELNTAGKKPAWIAENWSCGSGGCSYGLSLYYDAEDARKQVQCIGPL
jgi:hypothetical protein